MARTPNADDRVYFFHDCTNHKVKIGHSVHPAKRLEAIRTANPAEIVCLGTMPGGAKAEGYWHDFLAEHRHRGEWFNADDKVLAVIRAALLRNGVPLTVQDELTRRRDCRYGLKGVEVAVRGYGFERFYVAGNSWNHRRHLVLDLLPAGTSVIALRPNGTVDEHYDKPGVFTMYTMDVIAKMRFLRPDGALDSVSADDIFLMAAWPAPCPCWRD